jgi:hypothetical protein
LILMVATSLGSVKVSRVPANRMDHSPLWDLAPGNRRETLSR